MSMNTQIIAVGGCVTPLVSTYVISKVCKNYLGEEFVASVKLEVNFSEKTYNITPINGTKDFRFIKGDRLSIDLWSSVASVIDLAVEYVIELLYTTEVSNERLVLQEFNVKC